MKVTTFDESIAHDIGHAFGYYDYGDEHGLADAFQNRDAVAEYIGGYVRMTFAGGMLYTTSERGEGYIAYKLPGQKLGLKAMLPLAKAFFGIYRMTAPYSQKYAHSLRTGILGYLMFGVCGFHVPTCALVYLTKHGISEELIMRFAAYFVLPGFVMFWIFFLILNVTQIKAFAKGMTPCPKWGWIFSLPVGMLIAMLPSVLGNLPLVNALSCAWIAFGNVWMFGGLLVLMKKEK